MCPTVFQGGWSLELCCCLGRKLRYSVFFHFRFEATIFHCSPTRTLHNINYRCSIVILDPEIMDKAVGISVISCMQAEILLLCHVEGTPLFYVFLGDVHGV